jgi:hypothetical protein
LDKSEFGQRIAALEQQIQKQKEPSAKPAEKPTETLGEPAEVQAEASEKPKKGTVPTAVQNKTDLCRSALKRIDL